MHHYHVIHWPIVTVVLKVGKHIHSLDVKSVHVPDIVAIIYLLANDFDESRILYRRAFCSIEMLINEVMCEFLSR